MSWGDDKPLRSKIRKAALDGFGQADVSLDFTMQANPSAFPIPPPPPPPPPTFTAAVMPAPTITAASTAYRPGGVSSLTATPILRPPSTTVPTAADAYHYKSPIDLSHSVQTGSPGGGGAAPAPPPGVPIPGQQYYPAAPQGYYQGQLPVAMAPGGQFQATAPGAQTIGGFTPMQIAIGVGALVIGGVLVWKLAS